VLHARPSLEEERRDHLRYEFLERIYLLAGADCSSELHWQEFEEQFGPLGPEPVVLTRELAVLGFVRFREEPFRVCITAEGVDYLQRRAWRRRTIRGREAEEVVSAADASSVLTAAEA
jgi:hypothetical protein